MLGQVQSAVSTGLSQICAAVTGALAAVQAASAAQEAASARLIAVAESARETLTAAVSRIDSGRAQGSTRRVDVQALVTELLESGKPEEAVKVAVRARESELAALAIDKGSSKAAGGMSELVQALDGSDLMALIAIFAGSLQELASIKVVVIR